MKQPATHHASCCKTAGDSNRTKRLNAIRVLQDFRLKCFGRNIGGKAMRRDCMAGAFDLPTVETQFTQNRRGGLCRHRRSTCAFMAIFWQGHKVVEIAGSQKNGHVARCFTLGNDLCIRPNAIRMRHIMGCIAIASGDQMRAQFVSECHPILPRTPPVWPRSSRI